MTIYTTKGQITGTPAECAERLNALRPASAELRYGAHDRAVSADADAGELVRVERALRAYAGAWARGCVR